MAMLKYIGIMNGCKGNGMAITDYEYCTSKSMAIPVYMLQGQGLAIPEYM